MTPMLAVATRQGQGSVERLKEAARTTTDGACARDVGRPGRIPDPSSSSGGGARPRHGVRQARLRDGARWALPIPISREQAYGS